MFKGKQKVLFERLKAFGFDKFDAEFLVKNREVTARGMLKGFRRKRRERCLEPGCTVLINDPPKRFCPDHRFKRLLGMNIKDPSIPYHSVG